MGRIEGSCRLRITAHFKTVLNKQLISTDIDNAIFENDIEHTHFLCNHAAYTLIELYTQTAR